MSRILTHNAAASGLPASTSSRQTPTRPPSSTLERHFVFPILLRALHRLARTARNAFAVTESAAILTAAHEGKVATLVLRSTPPLWGSFEPQSASVQLRSVRAAGDDDLLDLALSYTLRSGGQAITVAADELEGGVPMVASLKA